MPLWIIEEGIWQELTVRWSYIGDFNTITGL